MTYIDECFGICENDEESDFWERNMEMFDYENYFPNNNKQVDNGAWIKVRTETGFEVHYAKRSTRKRRFSEDIVALQKDSIIASRKNIRNIQSDMKYVGAMSPKVKAKQTAIIHKIDELYVRQLIVLTPYEVKINRTKSKIEYLLPYQYTIVEDVTEFVDAYIQGISGVTSKTLFTSHNEAAEFYLQSRGISRKNAEMLAALKQSYFKVNMIEAMDMYNENFKKQYELQIN